MEKLTKIIYYLGIIFMITFLLHSVVMLFLLNESIFEMKEAKNPIVNMEVDSLDIHISYSYEINEKEYRDKYVIFLSSYEKYNLDTIIVKYNNMFPSVSYIKGISLKSRNYKLGIYIYGFIILFLVCLWNFGNKDKWYKQREQVTNRPWIFPADKTIKNPWKRFWKRLFNKELADKYDKGLL